MSVLIPALIALAGAAALALRPEPAKVPVRHRDNPPRR